jgi:ribose-phosphate pyrophosphokinase
LNYTIIPVNNLPLARKLALRLKAQLLLPHLEEFPNQEARVYVPQIIKGQNIILLVSLTSPVDRNLIYYLLLGDAVRRGTTARVLGLIPWLAYSPQDKIFRPGEPLSAQVIANLLNQSGTDRFLFLDLHNPTIQGFFNPPAFHLTAFNLFVKTAKKLLTRKSIVISPDFGALKASSKYAEALKTKIVHLSKKRSHTGKVTITKISDQIKNHHCFIFDDFLSTGSTAIKSAAYLKKQGAKKVYFFVSHPLFAKNSQLKIARSAITHTFVTNGIELQPNLDPKKFTIIDLSLYFANRGGETSLPVNPSLNIPKNSFACQSFPFNNSRKSFSNLSALNSPSSIN